jgi:hypothetical protein
MSGAGLPRATCSLPLKMFGSKCREAEMIEMRSIHSVELDEAIARGRSAAGSRRKRPRPRPPRSPRAAPAILLRAGGVEVVGSGRPIQRSIAARSRAGQAHEVAPSPLDAGRMADAGQIIGDLLVADIFAFDQHAVEVEDEPIEPQLRSPNKARADADVGGADRHRRLEIADMPMLRPATPCRRASLASSAK